MRRAIGVITAVIPFVAVALSPLTETRLASLLSLGGVASSVVHVAGVVLFALGASICLYNAYLSFVRPKLYEARHGTMEGYLHVSGLPIFGSLFVLVAVACLPRLIWIAAIALPVMFFDTGGWHSFVYSTWHDDSF